MMGSRQAAQGALFHEFSLEDHVPADHLIRLIDRFVELDGIRHHLGPFYSSISRPSVDPELMIRMLLIGYCFGIRSERRLCEEVHLNLVYRRFCCLGLPDRVPDHSTFSKNRHGRFRDSDLFRHLFETVVARCIAEDLVGGETFGADASSIKAEASRHSKVALEDWTEPETISRATQEYLDTLDDAAFGAATRVQPKTISPSDPAARFTGANGDRVFFADSTKYLVDLDNAVIVDLVATAPIRQAEVGAVRYMLVRVPERFSLHPERLAADTAYGSADMLGWLVKHREIAPHPGVRQDRAQGRSLSCNGLRFPTRGQRIHLPRRKEAEEILANHEQGALQPRAEDNTYRYYASKADCSGCALKTCCTPNQTVRKIARHMHEDARDTAREIAKTDAYVASS